MNPDLGARLDIIAYDSRPYRYIHIYIYKVHAKLAVEKAWEDAHHETYKALYHIISV